MKINNGKKFNVTIKFLSEVLGSASLNPNTQLQHVIESSRKSIQKWRKSNSKRADKTTFLEAAPIKKDEVWSDLQGIRKSCEVYLGEEISEAIWEQCVENNLSKDTILFKRIREMSGCTVFRRSEDGHPYLPGYVAKGMLKDYAAIACQRSGGVERGKVFSSQAYTHKMFNLHVFVEDDIFFYDDKALKKKKDVVCDEDGMPLFTERSLRAKTAQGEMIALARSEAVSEGAYVNFTIKSFLKDFQTKSIVKDLLTIGEDYGFSQWRNSGKGRFKVVSITEK